MRTASLVSITSNSVQASCLPRADNGKSSPGAHQRMPELRRTVARRCAFEPAAQVLRGGVAGEHPLPLLCDRGFPLRTPEPSNAGAVCTSAASTATSGTEPFGPVPLPALLLSFA